MIVKLIVTKGQDDGKIYYVRPGETRIIGRSSKTDIPIHDVGVSRLHCEVRNSGEQVILLDMNSRNGTSVNGRRLVGEHVLQDRDVVGVGTTSLLARLLPEDAVPASVKPVGEAERPDVEAVAPPTAEAPDLDRPAAPVILDLGVEEAAKPEAPTSPAGKPALLGSFEQWLEIESASAAEKEEKPKERSSPPPVLDLRVEPEASPSVPEPVARPVPPTAPVRPAPQPDAAAVPVSEAGVLPEQATPGAEPTGPDPRVGTVIGGCHIEGLIAADELSRTYRAVQKSMDRPVMLKILTPEKTQDERAVKRFLRAARSGGKLSHPNIVQVYDAGVDQGVNFIAFEHVEGEPIKQLLQKQGRGRPLDLRLSLELIGQIAGALDYAHQQGVVHRNIKIDNIYVTRHNVAKLADMGFAKSVAEVRGAHGTMVGERLGDLFFAAPEQLVDASSAGPAADIYSLGAVLFVMLTGYLPFRAADEADILARVQRGERESVQRLNPTVPQAVCGIVDKAMDVDPARRYRRAGEMQLALRTTLEQVR